MVAYEQYGLQKISSLSPDAKQATDFSSLFVIQPVHHIIASDSGDEGMLAAVSADKLGPGQSLDDYFSYPLVVQCLVFEDRVDLDFTYHTTAVAGAQLEALSHQFEYVVQQLCERHDTALGSVSVSSPWDVSKAVEWSGEDAQITESCVHHLIEAQAYAQPNAPAVSAWDGQFTYSELDKAANRLAHLLVIEYGIKPEDLIHVCFEKSAWFTVAILAINKAGAAWVPLDPSHPLQRQQQIVQQTRARIAICSPDTSTLCVDLVGSIVELSLVLDDELLKRSPSWSSSPPACNVSPRNTAYVLFTSGSTGTPKGVVMEHGAVCTSQKAFGSRIGMTPDVRILQFATHVFDVCVSDIIGSLLFGACHCVPSEHIRMNALASFIHDQTVNWAILTPTFARTLRPEDVPSLKLLVVGGEANGKDILKTWFGKVRLVSSWGPAETCVTSALHEWQSIDESSLTIGRPVGGKCWIVDAQDPFNLAPIGCVGEVVIQGPTLLREYLSDPDKTAAATLTSLPQWASYSDSPGWNRFFKTGDLCLYNTNGTLEFVSRKDTQLKIRGLRVEPGEVEHHIRATLDGVQQVVVDVFKGKTGAVLVSYLCFTDEKRPATGSYIKEDVLLPIIAELKSQVFAMVGQLNVVLPQYMVPTLFVPCKYLPFITSAKIDRKGLQALTATLSRDELSSYSLVDSEKRPPATPMEIRMQSAWAAVLKIPLDSIGRDDSFLRIGGDSITAIQLVASARASGLRVTVQDIFTDPRLSAVAAKATDTQETVEGDKYETQPFSLLAPDELDETLSHIRDGCDLSSKQVIEDAYPCTSLQEGLMALAIKHPGSYVAKHIYQLPDTVDLARFKAAWEQTFQLCVNIRTRIVVRNATTIQAVVNEEAVWESTKGLGLRSVINSPQVTDMRYGSRLCRFALVEEETGERYFLLIIHHAVFDGWSLNVMLGTLYSIYTGADIPARRPFSSFINYTASIDQSAATEYWTAQLDGAQKASFPSASRKAVKPASRTVRTKIEFPRQGDTSVTKATILRAAWALVLARYCDTDDICFATTVSGRYAPVAGIDTMTGPAVATVPVRVRLDRQQSISSFLEKLQAQASDMVPFEQFGLQNISRISHDTKELCDFSSLFVVQPAQHIAISDGAEESIFTHNTSAQDIIQETLDGYFSYPLVIQGIVFDTHVDLVLVCDPTIVPESQVEALPNHFEHAIHQLLTPDDTLPLGTVSLTSSWDIEQAIERSGEDTERIHRCMHDIVEEHAGSHPDALAICAWDAEFTYSQLNSAANRLAHYLIDTGGVKTRDIVHLCFDKSAWHFVAMLAVNKAGATWAPLDPSHPVQRQQQLVKQTGATLALASPSNAGRCNLLVAKVITVTPELDRDLAIDFGKDIPAPTSQVTPDDPAYILFTSGSTGVPKGLVMEHGALCTSQIASAKRLRLTRDVRMLQFAAFVFDLSIGEIFGPLLVGAALCIPSEHTRMNALTDFIRDFQVTWAYLTPAFARTLNPDQVPGLELLLLGGEAVGRDILDTWFGRLRLVNAWGPAEACVFSTFHEWQSTTESPMTVGRPVGNRSWIVEPNNPQQLVPIGCIGEVVLQGPTLLREYLSDPERTAASTVGSIPSWAPRNDAPHWNRFFKTGDLCFYNPDGTIQFVSRKDTQVKIRGLRVELDEVEYYIRAELAGVRQVVVDVLKGQAGTNLMAYLCFSDETRTSGAAASLDAEDLFLPLTQELRVIIAALAGQLGVILPSYMVPTIYFPCRYMPSITSTKLDRAGLSRITATLSWDTLAKYSLVDSEKRAPATPMEIRVQAIWAALLKIPLDAIGRDDNFLRLGGDSIAAIQLVTAAHEAGLKITVQDIFDDPRLSAVASKISAVRDEETRNTQPFSMLPSTDLETIKSGIKDNCKLLPSDVIEDAYPCTSLQEGLMALAVKQPGSYTAKYCYQLPDEIDTARFKTAWARTVQLCSNLRTRIVLQNGLSIQAVIAEEPVWEAEDAADVHSVIAALQDSETSYGSRLCRYAFYEGDGGVRYFVLHIHHAVFDGWSLNVILGTLRQLYYNDETPVLRPFANFIEYTKAMDRTATSEYWAAQLNGAQRASFPPAANRRVRIKAVTRTLKTRIDFSTFKDTSITKATILRTAWALVLARYCETDDICFGTSVSGRQAPVVGIDSMAGPAVTTVPVRVQIDPEQSVSNLLENVQKQALEMVTFEQFGLQNISKIGLDIKEVCDFSSLFVIQPMQHMVSSSSASQPFLVPASSALLDADHGLDGYFTYPLVLQGVIHDNYVDLVLIFNPEVLPEPKMVALSHHFNSTTQQLLMEEDVSVSAVSVAGNWDMAQAIDYRGEEPEIIRSCIHELVEGHARTSPDAEAICAWDGTFTYAQLDSAANRLAHHLVDFGRVKPGDLVHVCFSKSAWFFVSILAINKVGAAWVPLDPSHPTQRHQQIIQQTGSSLILVSADNAGKCSSLVSSTIVVTAALDQILTNELGSFPPAPACGVTPDHAAYVLFTSGSTGTPKGLVMEHVAVCTSQTAISRRLRLTPQVRMLQFASFVFDLCIGEIVSTLISGATLCVPSEDIRLNGLQQFVRDFNITWAFLTPAFVRTLRPEDFPTLELLLLAGEAVTTDLLNTWFGKVRFVNGWGPAETCVFSTMHEWQSLVESPLTIGSPVGGFCWIVDPLDHQRLAPIGCVGEIVIQGPTILREYLLDPAKTNAATITSLPQWAPQRELPYWNRFFQSGDLCFYNANGTVEFVSRKDTQVKIRGLRVELGEVEFYMRAALDGIRQVVVDVFKGDAGTQLVSYLCYSDETRMTGSASAAGLEAASIFLPLTAELKSDMAAAAGLLSATLPSYMVPTMFLPCRYIPSITSTKVDRGHLRRITATLSEEMLAAYSLVDSEKRPSTTLKESLMQQIWAAVLKIPTEMIGRDDSFLRIGGDSITAIQLVASAREVGLAISVQDIFDDARLSAIAFKAVEVQTTASDQTKPFSLLRSDELDTIKLSIQNSCQLPPAQYIEDAYPCTSLQEGLMALSIKQPGSYVAKYVYKLHERIDTARFKEAWNRTVELCENLRTRIVLLDDASIQAVIHGEPVWESTENTSLASFVKATETMQIQYGSLLCRYALVEEEGEEAQCERSFILVVHHSIFDGWSMNVVLGTLHSLYQGLETITLQPFSGFIRYTESVDRAAAKDYWTTQLDGAQRATFPTTDRTAGSKNASRDYRARVALPQTMDTSITKATILRAAWALVLARYCDTDDICFGTTVSGRQAALSGVDRMAGPTVATVPIRMRLDSSQTIASFLQNVQTQGSEMIRYEQFGLQNISALSQSAKDACDFSSLFVIQPIQHVTSSDSTNDQAILIPAAGQTLDGYFSYPLVSFCKVFEKHVELQFAYYSNSVAETQLEAFSHQFEHVVQQLSECSESELGALTVAGPWDLRKAIERNNEDPEILDTCVHRLFEDQVRIQPDAPAIQGSDGEFTYLELDRAANRLANLLAVEYNVGPGNLIPVCFEKSAWFIVATVAINKAGAAWVPLDPSHPAQRLRQIVLQTGALVAIASPANLDLCSSLVANVVELSPVLDKTLEDSTDWSLSSPPSNVSSRDAAYVLFTSGSTGTPKGVVMQHGAVCTSQMTINKRLGVSQHVRVLQFAAYVFDVCIWEIFTTLMCGACICVPSDYIRMNRLKEFICDMKINWAYLTPTFAGTLDPRDVPGLELLLLGGEPVGRDILDTWFGSMRVVNAWGPAETCVYSALHEWKALSESPLSIGRPVAGRCWIVDTKDPQRLAPIGCIGELVVQGPTLLREYLNDAAKTEAAIETSLPAWVPQRTSPHWNRFYKTGDLCHYNSDGTIEYVGRKDTQIKIRGLRVELGEVEHHIRAALKGVRNVVVDTFKVQSGATTLAAYH